MFVHTVCDTLFSYTTLFPQLVGILKGLLIQFRYLRSTLHMEADPLNAAGSCHYMCIYTLCKSAIFIILKYSNKTLK